MPDEAFLLGMPGRLRDGAMTVKVVTVFESNRELPSHLATIGLYDPETGACRAFMDGTYITAIRTSAAAAVACDVLARPDARVLAIIGAGVQGEHHLRTFPLVREFDEIRVSSLYAEDAHRVAALHPRARAVDDPAAAVRGADVVALATHAAQPVIEPALDRARHARQLGRLPAAGRRAAARAAGRRAPVRRDARGVRADAGRLRRARRARPGERHRDRRGPARPRGRAAGDATRSRVYKAMGHVVEDIVAAELVYSSCPPTMCTGSTNHTSLTAALCTGKVFTGTDDADPPHTRHDRRRPRRLAHDGLERLQPPGPALARAARARAGRRRASSATAARTPSRARSRAAAPARSGVVLDAPLTLAFSDPAAVQTAARRRDGLRGARARHVARAADRRPRRRARAHRARRRLRRLLHAPTTTRGWTRSVERRLPYVLIDHAPDAAEPDASTSTTAPPRARPPSTWSRSATGASASCSAGSNPHADARPRRSPRCIYHVDRERLRGWREGVEAAGIARTVAARQRPRLRPRDRPDRRRPAARPRRPPDRDRLHVSDLLALGVMRRRRRARRRRPAARCPSIGFDDVPEAARAGLTTVRQPHAEKGAAALRLLLDRADQASVSSPPSSSPVPRPLPLPELMLSTGNTQMDAQRAFDRAARARRRDALIAPPAPPLRRVRAAGGLRHARRPARRRRPRRPRDPARRDHGDGRAGPRAQLRPRFRPAGGSPAAAGSGCGSPSSAARSCPRSRSSRSATTTPCSTATTACRSRARAARSRSTRSSTSRSPPHELIEARAGRAGRPWRAASASSRAAPRACRAPGATRPRS